MTELSGSHRQVFARSLFSLHSGSFVCILRRWWGALWCKHRRSFKFYPEIENTTWLSDGRGMGPHPTVVIECCLDCGKTWGFDYGE